MELFDILSDDLLVIVVILVLNRRLDLVQPVPLAADNLNGHGGVDGFFLSVNCHHDWHDKSEDNNGGNVETQELSFHVKPVITLHVHLVAGPVRENALEIRFPEHLLDLRPRSALDVCFCRSLPTRSMEVNCPCGQPKSNSWRKNHQLHS